MVMAKGLLAQNPFDDDVGNAAGRMGQSLLGERLVTADSSKKSLSDALLHQGKEYDNSLLWPWKTRRGMDEDQLSTDYMRGFMKPAVPGIAADLYNSMVESGQMIQGERKIDPGEVFMNAMDFAPGALLTGRLAPKGAVLGANVFQGGPNKYGPDGAADSLLHIGKGEGATAYGYGRYDAGNKEVAEQYKKDLSGFDELTLHTPTGTKAGEAIDNIDLEVAKYLEQGAGDAGQFPHNTVYYAKKRAETAGDNAALSRLEEYGPDVRMSYEKNTGHLYKHDLPDEDIARYLDWDKPLSEQPESVRKALENVGVRYDATARARADEIIKRMAEMAKDRLPNNQMREEKEWVKLAKERDALIERAADPTGEKIYQSLVDKNGALDWPVGSDRAARETYRSSAKQATSEALGKAGIPGLKYYDGGSRLVSGGADAQGTAHRILDAVGGDYDKAIELAKGRQARNNKGPVDPTSNLSKAIKLLENKFDDRTRNYVTWDQGVLDRMKLLERNGENMQSALLPMDEASRVAKREKIADLRAEANANRDDWAGIHRPPMKDSGAPAHDLTGGGTVFPDDVYSPNAVQYYGTGNRVMDGETVKILNELKGNPDKMVSIYRAVPSGAKGAEISAGDWVTVNRNYAKDHGEGPLLGDYVIIERRVRARDIYTNGDSIHEFGFDPAKADSADLLASDPGMVGLLMKSVDAVSNSPRGLLDQPAEEAGFNRQFLLGKMEANKRREMEKVLLKNFKRGMSGGVI